MGLHRSVRTQTIFFSYFNGIASYNTQITLEKVSPPSHISCGRVCERRNVSEPHPKLLKSVKLQYMNWEQEHGILGEKQIGRERWLTRVLLGRAYSLTQTKGRGTRNMPRDITCLTYNNNAITAHIQTNNTLTIGVGPTHNGGVQCVGPIPIMSVCKCFVWVCSCIIIVFIMHPEPKLRVCLPLKKRKKSVFGTYEKKWTGRGSFRKFSSRCLIWRERRESTKNEFNFHSNFF